MTETAQIRLAQQGDQQAWLSLVRQHQEVVFRFAWLLLDDADEAEDVAQETFLRAFRALHTFEMERPLRPWLLQIARNLAFNRRRSLRRYVAALKEWFYSQPHATDDPIRHLSQIAASEELRQAVQRLDAPSQEVIYLRYFLELSVAESAEALDVAPGTVKSRLSRALDRLRTLLTDEDTNLGKERT